jgi:hypothetical protein
MSRWVQYKKDINGRKWEVISSCGDGWNVVDRSASYMHNLPKAEYVLVDPPEQWEDVTVTYEANDLRLLTYAGADYSMADYRITKIDGLHNGPAFIVERKKS